MIKLPDEKVLYEITQSSEAWMIAKNLESAGFNECLAEVQRLNATAQPVSDGWVKCSERMPEIPYQQDQFIVYTDSMIVMAAWFNRVRGIFKDEHNGCVIDDVTHWMPLPAAPGGQDD